jgi:hypothetical protein
MTTQTKQMLFTFVWLACCGITIQFFRFRFGLFKIIAAYLIIGIPWLLYIGRQRKPKSN